MKKVYLAPQTEATELIANTVLMAVQVMDLSQQVIQYQVLMVINRSIDFTNNKKIVLLVGTIFF